MNTIIKLKEWSGLDNTTHVATSYRIATDEHMTNIIDELLHSETYVTLYNANVTIPLNTTYYVSIKRHLKTINNLDVDTEWTTPAPIRNYQEPSGVMLEEDITVDKPFIYIDKNELLDSDINTFLFKTSSFRSNVEGHAFTHFFIYDTNDKLLYSKMNVTENKLGIVIDKSDISLDNTPELIFKVIHVTPTGIESPVSVLPITLTNSNIIISSRLTNIVPYTDYTLKLTKVIPDKPVDIRTIEIATIDDKQKLWSAVITPGKLNYVIPYIVLIPNSKYLLKVGTLINDDIMVYNKKIMSTIETLGSIRNQPNYVYDNKISYIDYGPRHLINVNTTYAMLNNGKVIAKDYDTTVFKLWTFDILTYQLSDPVTIGGLNSLIPNDENMYIDVREDGTILLDCLNSDGVPTFLLYKYDSFRNTAILTKTIVRTDETFCLGYNNGIVRDSNNEYYYIPVGKQNINKLDIEKGVINNIYNISNTSNKNVLTRVEPGKLGVITGGVDILSYDLKTKEIYKVLTLPLVFRNRTLRLVNLINDDIFITVKYLTNEDTDYLLSYDSTEGVLRTIIKDYDGSNVDFKSSILLSNGELLLLAHTSNRDQYYKYH